LGVAWGLEPLHASLALTGGLVGVFCTVVQVPMLAMFHAWENFALSRSIAL
jgi:hypothetical protein